MKKTIGPPLQSQCLSQKLRILSRSAYKNTTSFHETLEYTCLMTCHHKDTLLQCHIETCKVWHLKKKQSKHQKSCKKQQSQVEAILAWAAVHSSLHRFISCSHLSRNTCGTWLPMTQKLLLRKPSFSLEEVVWHWICQLEVLWSQEALCGHWLLEELFEEGCTKETSTYAWTKFGKCYIQTCSMRKVSLPRAHQDCAESSRGSLSVWGPSLYNFQHAAFLGQDTCCTTTAGTAWGIKLKQDKKWFQPPIQKHSVPNVT